MSARTTDPLAVRLARHIGGNDWNGHDYADPRVFQPALFVASLLRARHVDPGRVAVVLGHSMGELAAMTYAGALPDEDALEVVVRRAHLCHEQNARRPGAMVVLIGADPARAEWLRRSAVARTGGVLEIAAWNNARQVTLAGDLDSITDVTTRADKDGLAVVPLAIAGAYHSPLMAEAADRFAAYLADIPLRPPKVEVISTILCRTASTPAELRSVLAMGLVAPVRWMESLTAAHARGITQGYDVGPGTILAKLSRRHGPTRVHPLKGVS
ncbi:ACP S-malonyltransferase [Streptomyces sp. NPDC096013]|uniref:ACP S-malonyltransferase n=1 Tax=Streptomyces sp. NPDC096013 TaxID=3366069 RepID=UPI0038208ACA